jgi:hypothetical protein
MRCVFGRCILRIAYVVAFSATIDGRVFRVFNAFWWLKSPIPTVVPASPSLPLARIHPIYLLL